MKVFLLADVNSVHVIKWASSLCDKGVDVSIFSLGNLEVDSYDNYPNIIIYTNNTSVSKVNGAFSKLKYLSVFRRLKKIVKIEKPDIIHAHYATSYGLLGALLNFKPFVLSIWGSDVYGFPLRSFLHKALLKFNLKNASIVLSTSKAMANEGRKYTDKKMIVTPFGINTAVFQPNFRDESVYNKSDIVIGTIKTLEYVYGIDRLIYVFKKLINKYPSLPLKLLIVGKGSLKNELLELVKKNNIGNYVVFTGAISHNLVPIYHQMLDVGVYLSREESFGVAILETCSVAKPVVVSKVGGLPEVVVDKETGFVVNSDEEAFLALEKLVLSEELRTKMGQMGRERVVREYDWNKNVDQMIDIYKEILSKPA